VKTPKQREFLFVLTSKKKNISNNNNLEAGSAEMRAELKSAKLELRQQALERLARRGLVKIN